MAQRQIRPVSRPPFPTLTKDTYVSCVRSERELSGHGSTGVPLR